MLELSALPESLAWIAAHARELLLAGFVLAAAWTDWRTFRIPNRLTLPGLVMALVYNATAAPGALGFGPAAIGAAIGLVALLPLWMVRALGAGDVKLMAGIGAFLGYPEILPAALFAFIAAGAAALATVAWNRVMGRALLNVGDILKATMLAAAGGPRPAIGALSSVGRLPFGLCACAGTLAWILFKNLR